MLSRQRGFLLIHFPSKRCKNIGRCTALRCPTLRCATLRCLALQYGLVIVSVVAIAAVGRATPRCCVAPMPALQESGYWKPVLIGLTSHDEVTPPRGTGDCPRAGTWGCETSFAGIGHSNPVPSCHLYA